VRIGAHVASTKPGAWSEAIRWRAEVRTQEVRLITERAKNLKWSPLLLDLLLQELFVDDAVSHAVGNIRRLPRRQYAEALAIALVLRHSWRVDDLREMATRLGLTLPRSRKRRNTGGRRRQR